MHIAIGLLSIAFAVLLPAGCKEIKPLRNDEKKTSHPFLMTAVSKDGLEFTKGGEVFIAPGSSAHLTVIRGKINVFYVTRGFTLARALPEKEGVWRSTALDIEGEDPGSGVLVDPHIVRVDEGYRLFYVYSSHPMKDPAFRGAMSFFRSAFSPDGIRWKREEGTRLEGVSIADPDVVRYKDRSCRMYYTDSLRFSIRSASSRDCFTFQKERGIRIYEGNVSSTLLFPSGIHRIYFHRREKRGHRPYIVSAVSRDGLSFEMERGIRVKYGSEGELDYSGVEAPSVLLHDGLYHMIYTTSKFTLASPYGDEGKKRPVNER